MEKGYDESFIKISFFSVLLDTLRELSAQTSIMSTPDLLPTEALQSVIQDTFRSHPKLQTPVQSYNRRTPLSSGQVTPLTSGQMTPLSTGQMTPLSSGQMTPLSSGQMTPLSSGQMTPLTSGQMTPLTSGQMTPLSSGQRTPLSSGQRTPGMMSSSGRITPLGSGQITPLSSGQITPLSSGQLTPVASGQETPTQFLPPSFNQISMSPLHNTIHMSGSMSPIVVKPDLPSQILNFTSSPLDSMSPSFSQSFSTLQDSSLFNIFPFSDVLTTDCSSLDLFANHSLSCS